MLVGFTWWGRGQGPEWRPGQSSSGPGSSEASVGHALFRL